MRPGVTLATAVTTSTSTTTSTTLCTFQSLLFWLSWYPGPSSISAKGAFTSPYWCNFPSLTLLLLSNTVSSGDNEGGDKDKDKERDKEKEKEKEPKRHPDPFERNGGKSIPLQLKALNECLLGDTVLTALL